MSKPRIDNTEFEAYLEADTSDTHPCPVCQRPAKEGFHCTRCQNITMQSFVFPVMDAYRDKERPFITHWLERSKVPSSFLVFAAVTEWREKWAEGLGK